MTRRFAPLLAFGILFLQILLMLVLAPKGQSFTDRYLRLNEWDSQHYIVIAEKGYLMPSHPVTSEDIHAFRANVVFFPGVPLAARAVSQATGWSAAVSLLLFCNLSCWMFWTFLILFMSELKLSVRAYRWTLGLVVLHPAAFFLVAGYTEAPFLAAFIGFLYCSHRWISAGRSWRWASAAVLCGAAMSSIRIVSFAAVPYPFLLSLANENLHSLAALKKARTWRALLIGLSGTVGAIAFFAWCQYRFGQWNLYFRLEEVGWANQRRWLAIVNPLSYVPHFFFEDTVDSFSRLSVTVTMGLFLAAVYLERLRKDYFRFLPLLLTAFVLFYIPLTGKANANMDSMIRYTLPPFILLMIVLNARVFEFQENPFVPEFRKKHPALSGWLWRFGLLFTLVVQVWFAMKFLRGHWVA